MARSTVMAEQETHAATGEHRSWWRRRNALWVRNGHFIVIIIVAIIAGVLAAYFSAYIGVR